MTREQALAALIECRQSGDTEAAHGDADRVLCDLLISLGYQDIVTAWKAVPKWYA